MRLSLVTTLGASAGETTVGELQLLGVVALLMAFALFATSRKTLSLRSSRPMVVLISGGWLAVAFGFLLGEGGFGVIGVDRFHQDLTPALQAAMGWVGLMLGLQARHSVLVELPKWIWRVVAVDALVVVLFSSAITFGVWAWLDVWRVDIWLAVAVLGCAAAGWALETRSLVGVETSTELQSSKLAIRAGGTLSALVWILVFGSLFAVGGRDISGAIAIDPGTGILKLLVCCVAAVLVAVVGRYALRIAGKEADKQLVIFLGMVALSAGFAGQLGVPALAVAALTGVALANFSDAGIREFERFILRADLVVATLTALLAGVLLSADLGIQEVALACGIAGLRLVFKPLVLRKGQPREAVAGALSIGPVRQSPAAIAIALSALLIEPSEMMRRVLGIIVMVGVISAILPVLLSWSDQRSKAAAAVGGGRA